MNQKTAPRTNLAPLYSGKPQDCPICRATHLTYAGAKDFGESCNDHFEGRRMFEQYDAPIPYYQCQACGFLFTLAFQDWTDDDFRDHVYNEHYILTDPLFESQRPKDNAALISTLFHREKSSARLLDFGGGKGLTAQHLRDAGFDALAYDRYHKADASPLAMAYDVISSFEVIEHVPARDQFAWMGQLASLLNDSPHARIVLSSELVRRPNGLSWWYVSPRNGHISVHSDDSLRILAARFGLAVTSISSSVHLLHRQVTWVMKPAANSPSLRQVG